MLNAKKSKSSCEISRDIGMKQPSVWTIMHKIRHAMQTGESELLKGIIEMDETYIGGKPRLKDKGKGKRGRGTSKTPVVGLVERGDEVRTHVMGVGTKMNFGTLEAIFKKNANYIKSTLITDEFRGYSPMSANGVSHAVINHQVEYVKGEIFTNTIEGFWSLIKRAWYGSHHHYVRSNIHLYVGETQYKHNNRDNDNLFLDTIKKMLGLQKKITGQND